jgi:hypothetical protein
MRGLAYYHHLGDGPAVMSGFLYVTPASLFNFAFGAGD